MQNDNININKTDLFCEEIREKLEFHEIPVDAACWNEIEARLNKDKKKKIIPFWWWFSGGAAVATFLLLLSLLPLKQDNNTIAVATKKIKHNKETAKTVHTEQDTNKANNRKEYKIISQKIQATNITTNNFTKQSQTLPDTEFQTITPDSTNNNTGNINTVQTTGNDSTTKTLKNRYVPDKLTARETKTATVKKRSEWLLAASINKAGSTSLGSPNDLFAADPNEDLANANPTYTNIMTANDFSEIKFYSAISAGIVVQKKLTDTYSIETGLMYSYLFSSFEKNGLVSYDATLTLHYLGIPVNLIAQVWKNKRWELYASGGGMIEKGLHSSYIQNQHSGFQTITTNAETGIDGVQWSVNGAIGTTYSLQKNIGIYFEPKISYFFDNNQPISARTRKPAIIGLTAGLRFQL